MRLRRLSEELSEGLAIEWRAFPLRPAPDPAATFKGTYREEAWRRCAGMSAGDGITYTPWPHDDYANWSLPALEAAKCVALQSPALFERLHPALYEAFFSHSRNIADPTEVERIAAEVGADVARLRADLGAGLGRQAVARDWDAAIADGVRSIPTVIFPDTGAVLVGLTDVDHYRAAAREAASRAPLVK